MTDSRQQRRNSQSASTPDFVMKISVPAGDGGRCPSAHLAGRSRLWGSICGGPRTVCSELLRAQNRVHLEQSLFAVYSGTLSRPY